jgi:hypothetical protein
MRFNLICNGMMLFNELDDQFLEIVVPEILPAGPGDQSGHVRRFTVEQLPTAQSMLKELPVGEYEIAGLTPTNVRPLSKIFDPRMAVVLKKGDKGNPQAVFFDRLAASKTCAIIKIPKPDVVRYYRGGEPVRDPLNNCAPAAFDQPRLAYDIAVLSYRSVQLGTIVRLMRANNPKPYASKQIPFLGFSWTVYSNDENPNVGPHETMLNDFLSISGAAADLNLSALGEKDGPCATGVPSIVKEQMSLFHEMPKDAGNPVPTLNSSEVICTFAVLSRG